MKHTKENSHFSPLASFLIIMTEPAIKSADFVKILGECEFRFQDDEHEEAKKGRETVIHDCSH